MQSEDNPTHKPTSSLPPLPPSKQPAVRFNREALTLEVRSGQHSFDVSLRNDGGLEFPDRVNSSRLPEELLGQIGEAQEEAAWEVFASRRFSRSAASLGIPDAEHDFESFDLDAILDAGCTLDWRTGAIHPKGKAPAAAGKPVPLLLIPESDESGADELICDRYLCRGGGMLITGPTGIGKSSLAMQLVISWALGQSCLGFRPARALSTLLVQAENDSGDLAEARDGVMAGLDLDEYESALVSESVAVATIDDSTAHAFGSKLEKLIADWTPDIVVLDPLLAYVGGEISKQEVASQFLRGILTPLIHAAECGIILLHHEGKPPREDAQGDRDADYLGLGSSELANWPRAIVAVQKTKTQGIYRMRLGKRWKRAGWSEPDGMPSNALHIKHAPQGIFWLLCDDSEQARAAVAQAPNKDALLAMVLPGKPVEKDLLIAQSSERGISNQRARTFLKLLTSEGKLFEWHIARSKCRPQVLIAREPQPEASLLPA